MRERVVDLAEHFWARVDTSAGPDGCWPWTLSTTSVGYGQVVMQGKRYATHVFAYMDRVGPVPEGLHLDHTCHNLDLSCSGGRECAHRRCCNPRHLVPKTPRDNLDSANLPRQRGPFVEQCPQGHLYDEENTGWITRGARGGKHPGRRERYCKACHRERARQRR